MRANTTTNQHFISRVEQKLNAANPQSTDENRRIYSFKIVNRASHQIALENPKGHMISSNLSMSDLFSFDVPGGGPVRMNLEDLFGSYESNIEVHTMSLLKKLAEGSTDIKMELIDLFAAKLLTFTRNPFCVRKVLNSFPSVTSYEPTDPGLLSTYRRIITGRKPQQVYLCQQLGISHQDYIEWLRLLFMLLVPSGGPWPSVFAGLIKALFESRDTQASAFIWVYDKDYCLLSDRGFCQRVPDASRIMVLTFNLYSHAFIDYAFADPAALLQGKAQPGFLARATANWRQLPPTINVTAVKNDRKMLANYNRRVIEQCRNRVFCAAKTDLTLS